MLLWVADVANAPALKQGLISLWFTSAILSQAAQQRVQWTWLYCAIAESYSPKVASASSVVRLPTRHATNPSPFGGFLASREKGKTMKYIQFHKYTRSDWRFVFTLLIFVIFGSLSVVAFFEGWRSFDYFWKITIFWFVLTVMRIWR